MQFMIALFRAPMVPGDELTRRRIEVLHFSALVAIVLALTSLVVDYLVGRLPVFFLLLEASVIPICLMARLLAARGRISAAGALLAGMGIAVVTTSLAAEGTVQSPTLSFYVFLVVAAGLLFDFRGLIFVITACSVAVAGLIYLADNHMLPSPNYIIHSAHWVTTSVVFGASGWLAYTSIEAVRNALQTAELELTERRKVEALILKKNAELEAALAEVKTLGGLLPICSGCKRIRDDKRYWHQVESYLSDHTPAQFSHGICPECAIKYYPGIDLHDVNMGSLAESREGSHTNPVKLPPP